LAKIMLNPSGVKQPASPKAGCGPPTVIRKALNPLNDFENYGIAATTKPNLQRGRYP
jgi:hypothetical protein